MVNDAASPAQPTLPSQAREYEWREQRGLSVWVRQGETGFGREQSVAEDPAPSRRPMKAFTMEEVKRHNKPDDLWFVIAGKVYDVSKWAEHHPGGKLCLQNIAGGDATDPFENYHPAYVWQKKLPRFQIGYVADSYQECDFVKDFRTVRQRLLAEGKFETDMTFYVVYGLWLASLLVCSVYLLVMRHGWVAHLVSALMLGLFWQQGAFLGHDVCHNAVTHVKSLDHTFSSTIGNAILGISAAWWKKSHNVHHIITNSVEHDPDIQHLPVFAVTDKIYKRPFWSTFHEKAMSLDSIGKWFVRRQHILYYPILFMGRYNLYVQSLKLLLSNEVFEFKRSELACLVLNYAGILYMLTYCPTIARAIVYLLVSHGFTCLLHIQITLSHFSMHTFHGRPTFTSEEDNWFKLQVATSMDVKTWWLTEWLHGGLQYQVEHHLFPRLPRQSLKYAQKLTRDFAARWNVPYHILSFYDANVHVIQSLKRAAEQARTAKTDAKFTDSMLWDALNARG